MMIGKRRKPATENTDQTISISGSAEPGQVYEGYEGTPFSDVSQSGASENRTGVRKAGGTGKLVRLGVAFAVLVVVCGGAVFAISKTGLLKGISLPFIGGGKKATELASLPPLQAPKTAKSQQGSTSAQKPPVTQQSMSQRQSAQSPVSQQQQQQQSSTLSSSTPPSSLSTPFPTSEPTMTTDATSAQQGGPSSFSPVTPQISSTSAEMVSGPSPSQFPSSEPRSSGGGTTTTTVQSSVSSSSSPTTFPSSPTSRSTAGIDSGVKSQFSPGPSGVTTPTGTGSAGTVGTGLVPPPGGRSVVPLSTQTQIAKGPQDILKEPQGGLKSSQGGTPSQVGSQQVQHQYRPSSPQSVQQQHQQSQQPQTQQSQQSQQPQQQPQGTQQAYAAGANWLSPVTTGTAPGSPAGGDQKAMLEALKREQYNIIKALQEQLKDLSLKVLASSNEISNVLGQMILKGRASAESWMALEENKKALALYRDYVETEKAVVASRLGIVSDIVKVIKDVNDVFGERDSTEKMIAGMRRAGGEESLLDTLRTINSMRAGSERIQPQTTSQPLRGAEQGLNVSPSSSPGRVAFVDSDSVTFSDGSVVRKGETYKGMTLKSIDKKRGTAKLCDGKKCITVN